MTIEEAIRSALEFENRVRDVYADAAEKAVQQEARQFFEVMTREEQGHVDYLESRLEQWQKHGELRVETVTSVVGDAEWMHKGEKALASAPPAGDEVSVVEHLYAALRLEEEVSTLYRGLIRGVEHPEAEAMFRRFLEIEDGHIAIVQAEIDYQSNTGLFYGVQEFTLDG